MSQEPDLSVEELDCEGEGGESGVTEAMIDESWWAVLRRMVDTEGRRVLGWRQMVAVEWLAIGVELGRVGCSTRAVTEKRALIEERRSVVAARLLRVLERKRSLGDVANERLESRRMRRGRVITLYAPGKGASGARFA